MRAVLPTELASECSALAATHALEVRCPPPAGGGEGARLRVIHSDLDGEPCAYVVNLGGERARRAGADPFHVVVAGGCGALPLRAAEDGRWAVDPPKSLRLVANPPLESGRLPRTSVPRVLARTRVGEAPALLLQPAAEPEGGLVHGGHLVLVWNEGRAGYALSAHFRDAPPGGRPPGAQVDALRAAAASMRPAERG